MNVINVNPFPRIAIAANPELYIDFDGQVARAISFFINAIESNEKATGTVIGGYGLGKTHTLKYIESRLAKLGVRSFFVPNPKRRITDLYRSVVENLLYDLDGLEVEEPLLKKALELSKGTDDIATYAKLWLLGESVPFNIRVKLGLGSNIDDGKAIRYLVTILKSLTKKNKGVALLMDEVEALLTLPVSTRAIYMELLRELIDELPPRTVLIVALTPAFWDQMLDLNAALARRLSSFIIYLRNLRRDEMPLILDNYLKRVQRNISIYDIFNDDILDYIYEISNGNPGEILKLAAVLVDTLIMREGLSKVTLEKAKEILAYYT